MRILQIEIEEFGKLSACRFTPGTGLTLIEGPNESGKSTLLAFLRFALYGFPRKNGPDGEERDKRLSWQNRRAAGKLTVESGGAHYRISRCYALRGTAKRPLPTEELSVIDLATGTEVEMGEKTPGEHFLGLPPELYDSSLCVRQSDVARVSAPGMGAAVENLLYGDGSQSGAKNAEKLLENARRELQYRKGRGGKVAQCEDALARLDAALSRAREDAVAVERTRTEAEQLHAQLSERRAELDRVSNALERAGDAQILADFDELRCARAREEQARQVWESTRNAQSAHLADPIFFNTVGALLLQCESAETEIVQHAATLADLRAVRPDEARMAAAARIRESGGEETLLAHYTQNRRKSKRSTAVGGTLAGAAVILAPIAVLFSAIRLPAIGVAAVLAIASIAFLLSGIGARYVCKKLLRALGVENPAMLRTYLAQCRTAAAQEEQRTAAVREAEQAKQTAEQTKKRALEALAEQFAKAGAPMAEPSVSAARRAREELARGHAEAQSAITTARMEYERAKSAAEVLGARLSPYEENAIRARIGNTQEAPSSPDALRQTRDALSRTVAELEERHAEARRRESTLTATAADPADLEAERAQIAAEYTEAKRRLAAVELALEALDEASLELRRNVTPTLAREASALLGTLTAGKHDTLYLDADLSPAVESASGVLPLSHFSAGCRDAAHLALRLALLESISQEKPPLLFDEALSRLDDERARALLEVLQRYCREGGQCLLFSCHTRETAWLADSDATIISLLQ